VRTATADGTHGGKFLCRLYAAALESISKLYARRPIFCVFRPGRRLDADQAVIGAVGAS
jgi:hypothetical protein